MQFKLYLSDMKFVKFDLLKLRRKSCSTVEVIKNLNQFLVFKNHINRPIGGKLEIIIVSIPII